NALARATYLTDRETRIDELNDVVGFFAAALHAAHPRRLDRSGLEWAGFLNALSSGVFAPAAFGSGLEPLACRLGTHRVTFAGQALETRCGLDGSRRIGAVLSVKTYPAGTSPAMLQGLDPLVETVVTSSFTPLPRNIVAERIQRTIRQMRAAEDAAVSLAEELRLAADDLESGRISFGEHHTSIVVYAETAAALERAIAHIKAVGQDAGMVIVREGLSAKAVWFAQHPGNFGHRARRTTISSANFADFATLFGSNEGRAAESAPWRTPITVFQAVAGNGYRLHFHEPWREGAEPTLGHTLVLGSLGSGKTLTSAFLAAEARRAGVRLFAFDKDQGLEMAIRALGGRYHRIRAGVPTGLNPFATETDARGRAWLTDWLAEMWSADAALTGEQSHAISVAVEKNARAAPELQAMHPFSNLFRSLDDGEDLAIRIGEWIPGGRYGWIFDRVAREEALVLADDIAGFDMTEILDMTTERTAVLSYIFRQIERLIEDRRPTILLIDEAWKVLGDAYFARHLENWLVTLRKLNCVVLMLTQFPSQLRDSRVGAKIVETVPTQILFPNQRAKPADYGLLGVNAREAEILCGACPGRRVALIRSVGDSVLVDTDLSALGPLLPILGGGAAGEALLRPGWRDRPEFWREVLE
ncbi:MAG: type IV secretion system protein B4, partial [Pseudomonadota bacterium]